MPEKAKISIIGLGPGGAGNLSRAAWEQLQGCEKLYVLDRLHPAVAELPQGLEVEILPSVTAEQAGDENQNTVLAARLVAIAAEQGRVCLALPGSGAGSALGGAIHQAALAAGMSMAVFPAVDGLAFALAALDLDLSAGLALAEAGTLSALEVPNFSPTQAAIISGIQDHSLATELKLTLMANYPDEWPVKFVHEPGLPSQGIEDCLLWQIDRSVRVGAGSLLYLPPLAQGSSLEDFQQVIARLHRPDGCPWDREQTHLSLRPYLLEEAYEVLEALDQEDTAHLQEELGDLLLQILLHAQIGAEDQEFKMSDVLRGISQKLIRRHPHVFASLEVDGVDGVIQNWEKIKAAERKTNGGKQKGMLDGIPSAMPALTQAQQIQQRAKRVGFDWDEFEPVVAKLREEIGELLEAQTEAERVAEAGDLLFAAVNVIRWLDLDPEMALRDTNSRFRKRFAYIEAKAREQGKSLQELGFAAMDAYWEEAKRLFAAGGEDGQA